VNRKKILVICLLAMCQWHCIQSYVSPYKSPTTGYLVVEGYVSGSGPSSFTLSRTISLPGDSAIPMITGASLRIEGNDNSVYPFSELGNGRYILPSISLNPDIAYRLRISNVGSEEYLSDFVPVKATPPIDSINWGRDDAGLTIYANTHDPAGTTRYYQWKFNETYQYASSDMSGLIWDNTKDTLIYRPPEQQIYNCWHTDSSTQILIGTSEKLGQDIIYRQPLLNIAANTRPLGIVYSVLVSQYALTQPAYEYLSRMQKNTEQLGSIFDAQPTQLIGNIHSTTNPAEPVIGYVSAGTIQQQRIYIYNHDVPNWFYSFNCPLKDREIPPLKDSMIYYFGSGQYTPITIDFLPIVINVTSCVDCRTQGGTNIKPPYMP
jgi:hypothetical protein